jgi:uncharacterized membrane protein SpoIIM required for sporulation
VIGLLKKGQEKSFLIFLLPLIISVAISSIISFQRGYVFYLDQEKINFTFVAAWLEVMREGTGLSAVHIIINNSAIIVLFWVLAVFPLWISFKKKRSEKQKALIAVTASLGYLIFFTKESFRLSIILLSFQDTFGVPFLSSLLTNVLPHGVVELGSFILAAAWAVRWLAQQTAREKFIFPNIKHIAVPLASIIIAGLLETSLTPYLFKSFLSAHL